MYEIIFVQIFIPPCLGWLCAYLDTCVLTFFMGPGWLVLLWLEPPLANDFCNFLNKIAKIMKIFVKVDLLKGYQPLY